MKLTRKHYSILLIVILASSLVGFEIGSIISTEVRADDNVQYSREPDTDTSTGVQDEEIEQNALCAMASYFTENLGQCRDESILYYGNIPGGMIGFAKGRIVLITEGADKPIEITFPYSNSVLPKGELLTETTSNFYLGSRGTYTGVRTYTNVKYEELWEGIDLIYKAGENGTKYEFVVYPAGDPSDIQIAYENMEDIEVEETTLTVKTGQSSIVDTGLITIQDTITVTSSFVHLGENIVGFELGDYDSSKPLIIDPLVYSTFVGGSSHDKGVSIVIDSENYAYIIGATLSSAFPTVNAYDTSFNGGWDVFILKMNPSGSSINFSTFIGGTDEDVGMDIDIDSSNTIYATGYTYSDDFPTTYEGIKIGSTHFVFESHFGDADIFIIRLSSDGSDLRHSTFMGGAAEDRGMGIVVVDSDNVYLTGFTKSSTLQVRSAYDSTHNGGADCFVAKLQFTNNQRLYVTYVGSGADEYANDLAVDSSGNAYVTGTCPTGIIPSFPSDATIGGSGLMDAFVFKLNGTGNGLDKSIKIGGVNNEEGRGIEVSAEDIVFVGGWTASHNFPTASPADPTFNGQRDGFGFKLNMDTESLVYSTFIGGSETDEVNDIAIDSYGHLYLTGTTNSTNMPIINHYDQYYNGNYDIFFTVLKSGGGWFTSSYIGGGSSKDSSQGICVDSGDGRVYFTGYSDRASYPSDFPTTSGAFDETSNGLQDCIIFVFEELIPPTLTNNRDLPNPDIGQEVTMTTTITDVYGSVSISDVHAWYRAKIGEGSWSNYIELSVSGGGSYEATIPSMLQNDTQVEYHWFAYDNHGNRAVSPTGSYLVADDEDPAVGTFSHDPTAPGYTDSVEITAEVTDNGILNKVELWYRVDSGDYSSISMIQQPGNSFTAEIPAQSYGSLVEYYIYAEDSGENSDSSSIDSYTVGDFIAPVFVEMSYSPEYPEFSQDATVETDLTDAASGIDLVRLYYRTREIGGQWSAPTFVVMSLIAGDEFEGTYQESIPSPPQDYEVIFWIYAADNEGNILDNHLTNMTYQIYAHDEAGPDITFEYDPTTITDLDDVVFTATVTDYTGVHAVTLSYSTNGQISWTNVSMIHTSGDEYEATISSRSIGTTIHYKIYAVDVKGNWEETETDSYTVEATDSTGPNISPSRENSNPTDATSVLINAIVTDSSGIDQVFLDYRINNDSTWISISMTQDTVDSSIWYEAIPIQSAGTKVIYRVRACDEMGNWRTSSESWYIVVAATPDKTLMDILRENVFLFTVIGGVLTIWRTYVWRKDRSKTEGLTETNLS
ncbi:MAG: SBBP repeat-containing protein [Candidatus Thorarchaeota archaeon]